MNDYGPWGWIFGIVIALVVVVYLWDALAKYRRVRALQLSDVDHMTGTQFEGYVATLLRHKGYRVERRGKSGDLGVDLTARKGSECYAVQCKRQTGNVSRRAVSDAVAGMAVRRCNKACVITNRYFTKGAITLARANKCRRVDRGELSQWIVEFRKPN